MSKTSVRAAQKARLNPAVRLYNPLTESDDEICRRVGHALARTPDAPLVKGSNPAPSVAGAYALYYYGRNKHYRAVANGPGTPLTRAIPIYIGKAANLHKRLLEHADSIAGIENKADGGDGSLRLRDFRCRWLPTGEVKMALVEEAAISFYFPAWNDLGFGASKQGHNRAKTALSSYWDHLHIGRKYQGLRTAQRTAEARIKAERETAEQIDHLRRYGFVR